MSTITETNEKFCYEHKVLYGTCRPAHEVPHMYYGLEFIQPIPMLLWCPKCGTKHIDPPGMEAHHTHACQNRSCGLVWKPSLARTHGVEFLPGCENKP